MAKKIRTSTDGITWYTLPGNQGDLKDETGSIEDTIFGQAFKSADTGLINTQISANAIYKGMAGYQADIYKPGVSTVFTTEAFTLVSGKTYQINDQTKRMWDRLALLGTGLNVFDNAINQNANVLSVDYLHGRVTFKSTYTVVGPVTVTGKYFPRTQLASYRGFTLTQSLAAVDLTDMPTAQSNGGVMVFDGSGLKTVQMELQAVYNTTNAFRAALIARSELIIEINPDGASQSLARGFFKFGGRSQKGNLGALEEEDVTMRLYVPDQSLMEVPFSWNHLATTTLNTAIQQCLSAWQNSTILKVQYLPDGVTGFQFDTIVTDFTLTSGLEKMNEFSAQFQATGAVTLV